MKLFNYIDEVNLSESQKQQLAANCEPQAKPQISLARRNGLVLAAGLAAVALFFGAIWVFGDVRRTDDSWIAGVAGEGRGSGESRGSCDPSSMDCRFMCSDCGGADCVECVVRGLMMCCKLEARLGLSSLPPDVQHPLANAVCHETCCYWVICDECSGANGYYCYVSGIAYRIRCECNGSYWYHEYFNCSGCYVATFCPCGMPTYIRCDDCGRGTMLDHVCGTQMTTNPQDPQENPPIPDPPTYGEDECTCEERWGIQLCQCGGPAGGLCGCDNPCPRSWCGARNCW
jgi:hypothetical protein